MRTFEEVYELARLLDEFDFADGLHWMASEGEVSPLLNCNDMFAWGCADGEVVTSDDLPALRQAFVDCEASGNQFHGLELWVARKRGQRPQGAWYKHFTPEIAALFDAAGPRRETGIGNPRENIPQGAATLEVAK